ncbi:MAG: DNA recombination protein RmuC [Asgard group archaeon]|nr:DNA recombination protein RmuC [Asgard group archaeon]
MADIVLYVLISIACLFGFTSLIYQIIIQRKKKTEINVYKDQMQYAVDQTTREMQRFFDVLRMKPTAKGDFGENIVDMLLSNLPSQYVRTQYQPKDLSGSRIDFVVKLPHSNLLIPIDSKFILPKYFDENTDFQRDKIAADRLNKEVIKRGKEITKYVKSAETTDFVLMFIPDLIYSLLKSDSFQVLASMNVVPTNTSGLLSTIFMIKMQHRFVNLNSAVGRFGLIQMNVCQGLREVIDKIRTGSSQLQHSMNNLSDVVKEISELNSILESLDTSDL